jgi:hydroxymethylpyrimidine pyrophosphatase-like HAD family hydrolase
MDPRQENEGWIGVDLDGTLAYYDGFKGDDVVGEPIEPMVRQVRKWLADGRDVRIFTARSPHPVIRKFCKDNLGKILPITNLKDHKMQALYDDRAVGIKRNEGIPFDDDNVEQVFGETDDEESDDEEKD